jgi:hypothetical protein
MEAELRGLEFVGKLRVSEPRRIEYPSNDSNREKMTQWLKDNAQEKGWIVSTYLGSQGSVERKDGKIFLNYHVTKYIDP